MKNKQYTVYLQLFLSALMLMLSTPPFKFFYLSFFALSIALRTLNYYQKPFLNGFMFGFFYNLMSMYWITYVLSKYGNFNYILSFSLCLLLVAYLSLYPAIFFFVFFKFKNSLKKIFVPLVFGFFWVVLEFIRSRILTGFPWILIGYTQYNFLPFIQIASFGGVYLVSFFVVFFNLSVYVLFEKERYKIVPLLCSLIIFIFIVVYGKNEIERVKKALGKKRAMKVILVQGNIDQSQKWVKNLQKEIIKKHIDMTRKHIDGDTKLVIWSETALPIILGADAEVTEFFREEMKGFDVPLITGFVGFKWDEKGKPGLTNSAGIFYKGELIDRYDKVHLVPFGEYVPLQQLLFFVNKLVAVAGDFLQGETIKTCKFNNLSCGIMICYESIFPEISKKLNVLGADILVNLTNDAWFGRSPAPYQHFAMSIFRAVENRKYLIRVANTGISGIITPWGEPVGITSLYTDEVIKGVVYY
jgi:apolipoprotein N-acyltransferase